MKNINVNELLTYSDFEKYKNKVVYAVSYSEFIINKSKEHLELIKFLLQLIARKI